MSQPDLNPIVVKCEVCGQELTRDGYRWAHPQPVDPEFPHEPAPVPA